MVVYYGRLRSLIDTIDANYAFTSKQLSKFTNTYIIYSDLQDSIYRKSYISEYYNDIITV